MVALSPQRRQAMHECISNALRDMLSQSLAEIPSYAPPHGRRSSTQSGHASSDDEAQRAKECIAEAVAAVQGVFDAAVGCISEEWNATHRDMLMSLPAELVTECFRWLDLDDCISASHVSRAWRRAALADCWLWNEYVIPRQPLSIENEVHALSTLLARSNPVPFDLACFLPGAGIPDAVYNLIASNLHRMADLHFYGGVHITRVLKKDAPLLEGLGYLAENEDQLYVFPVGWGAQSAPRLQSLFVLDLSIPSDSPPFTALLELRARLSQTRMLDISFCRVFPNITLLDLRSITQAVIPLLTPLPPSLREINLVGSRDEVDYSPLFCTKSMPGSIRTLSVTQASGFQAALELFGCICAGLWKLEFDGERRVTMQDTTGAVSWCISSRRMISLSSEEGLAPHLALVSELDLPLETFAKLHKLSADVWDRALPCLRVLRLAFPSSCRMYKWRPILEDCFSDDPRDGILMPVLHFVELCVPEPDVYAGDYMDDVVFADWLRLDAPSVLPPLFSSVGTSNKNSIARILIRTDTSLGLTRKNVACLLRLAKRVLVGTSADPEDIEISFDRSTTTRLQ